MIRAKDNPFAARWVDAVEYIGLDEPLDAIYQRLKAMNCTAAVVGPHGSGKSTLLRHLRGGFEAEGIGTRSLFISRDVKLPWRSVTDCVDTMDAGNVLFFDGANHLPFMRFLQLKRMIRRHRAGLVITSHTEGLLPTLVRCRTTPELLGEILGHLPGGYNSDTSEKLEALYHLHKGNIRDCLWQLYDEYTKADPI